MLKGYATLTALELFINEVTSFMSKTMKSNKVELETKAEYITNAIKFSNQRLCKESTIKHN